MLQYILALSKAIILFPTGDGLKNIAKDERELAPNLANASAYWLAS